MGYKLTEMNKTETKTSSSNMYVYVYNQWHSLYL